MYYSRSVARQSMAPVLALPNMAVNAAWSVLMDRIANAQTQAVIQGMVIFV